VPALVTDGAYLPDGRFVLRTYTTAYVYDRPGQEVARAELPAQQQGESVASDGDRLLVGSEGVHSQVLAVPVPSAGTASPSSAASSPARSPSPSTRTGDATGETGAGPVTTWALPVVGGLVLLAGLAVVLRRRRR
jgi:hypothetical protein